METSIRVGMPIIQTLGMQGEHLLVKVLFPVDEVVDDPNIHDGVEQAVLQPQGKRAIILKMRTEDLPMISHRGEIPHFDVGEAIRESWNS